MPRRQASVHLSGAEIDAYWTARLDPADQERVELHFLECAECRERVGAVEMLVDALRLDSVPAAASLSPLRAWQSAAAVLAVLALGATWRWARLAHDAGVNRTPPATSVMPGDGSPATLRIAVEPPTRSASRTELTLPPTITIVVFDLDAREAGAPQTMFDVSLIGPDGRSIMRVAAPSSAAGRIEVPVHRALLMPGRFQFDVAHGAATVALPLLINWPIPR